MQTVVVYDSKFGNTERVAEAIARGAGPLGARRRAGELLHGPEGPDGAPDARTR
jgi:flavodoxin